MPADGLAATAVATNGSLSVRSSSFSENLTVSHDGESPLKLVVYVDYGALGGLEYVIRLPLQRADGQYRALTPYLEVCDTPRLCGGEAAYVPSEHREGIWMNATLEATTND
jgi:hypothetical protein